MWLAVIAFVVCLSTATATAQCPIQLRQASFDTNRKSIVIRYYNSGTRVVRDVRFVVVDENARTYSMVGSFSARTVVRPKKEQKVAFSDITGRTPDESMHLEVVRVTFKDDSSWAARGRDVCEIGFTVPSD